MENNPLIVSIDTKDMGKAKTLCQSLVGVVGGVKISLDFIFYNGVQGINEIAKLDLPIFLDSKLHDSPKVIESTIDAIIHSCNNVNMLSLHCLGGCDMLRRAVDEADNASVKYGKKRPLLIGVSFSEHKDMSDINEIGLDGAVEDEVVKLAELAKETGLDGLLCSPHELSILRRELGYDFRLAVSGICSNGKHDALQNCYTNFLTPKRAMEKGADYIIIGDDIKNAEDPREKAEEITKDLGVDLRRSFK